MYDQKGLDEKVDTFNKVINRWMERREKRKIRGEAAGTDKNSLTELRKMGSQLGAESGWMNEQKECAKAYTADIIMLFYLHFHVYQVLRYFPNKKWGKFLFRIHPKACKKKLNEYKYKFSFLFLHPHSLEENAAHII